MNEITTSYLAKKVKGNLIGDIKPVKGVFTFLNRAKPCLLYTSLIIIGISYSNNKSEDMSKKY